MATPKNDPADTAARLGNVAAILIGLARRNQAEQTTAENRPPENGATASKGNDDTR